MDEGFSPRPDPRPSFAASGSCGNDREEKTRRSVGTEMQRRFAPKDLGRSVARVFVQERAAPFKLILEVRQPAAARSLVLVILSAHSEADAVASRHDDGGWPDLNVQLDYLAWSQRLLLIVGVIRPVRCAQVRIELAVRGPEPSLTDGSMRINRALKHNLLSIRREDAKHNEGVRINR